MSMFSDEAYDEILLGAKIEKRAIELAATRAPKVSPSRLTSEDQAFLEDLITRIQQGHRAVIIVDKNNDIDGQITYMFSNTSRTEAAFMLSRVTERNAHLLLKEKD